MKNRIANKNAGYYANSQLCFEGSNLYGGWDTYFYNGEVFKYYYVRSYNTDMFYFFDGHWIKNICKYSKTTSQQVNSLYIYNDHDALEEKEMIQILKDLINIKKIKENYNQLQQELTKKDFSKKITKI